MGIRVLVENNYICSDIDDNNDNLRLVDLYIEGNLNEVRDGDFQFGEVGGEIDRISDVECEVVIEDSLEYDEGFNIVVSLNFFYFFILLVVLISVVFVFFLFYWLKFIVFVDGIIIM